MIYDKEKWPLSIITHWAQRS